MESKPDIYRTFSNIVLSQSSRVEDFRLLTEGQDLLSPLLPSMIRNLCFLMEDPNFTVSSTQGPYYFSHFPDLPTALKTHPHTSVKKTLPHEVFQFMQSSDVNCLFDSEKLGVSLVSKAPLEEKKLNDSLGVTLEPFLTYTFCNELWGSEGKWTLFHQRLLSLFNQKSLLISTLGPGLYLLDKKAQRLEKYGVKGTMKEEGYLLQMTWAYPLAALQELMNFTSQEF